jgi:hypothetical protein
MKMRSLAIKHNGSDHRAFVYANAHVTDQFEERDFEADAVHSAHVRWGRVLEIARCIAIGSLNDHPRDRTDQLIELRDAKTEAGQSLSREGGRVDATRTPHGLGEALENHDIVTGGGEAACHGRSSGTTADDGDLDVKGVAHAGVRTSAYR